MNNTIMKEELVNNSIQSQNEQSKWKPSKKWLKKLRTENTDYYLIDKIRFLIDDEEWKDELLDMITDSEGLYVNYPRFTEIEVQNYLIYHHDMKSKFQYRLKRFLNKEVLKMETHYSNLSEKQKEWLDENTNW